MKYYKKVVRRIAFHGGVLLKGFIKMLYGTTVAMLTTVAAYGFAAVSTLGGYEAVLLFLMSIYFMLASLIGIYFMGADGQKGAKK